MSHTAHIIARGGSRISGEGFRCVEEGFALLILSHFSNRAT